MKYTHILWDFNGTILDDVEAGIKSVNKLLTDRDLPIIDSLESYHRVFGFPIIDYYRRLGFDFEKEPYEVIAPIWVEQYLINVKESKVFNDILPAAEKIRSLGLKQIILSATEIDMLKMQLKDLEIENVFDGVLGLDNIHAESKVRIAERWKGENPHARPLIIGDTVHDAEVARAIGSDCILVARGHQARRVLEECGFAVTDNAEEVVKKYLL